MSDSYICTHAGGVVYREVDEGREYLIVRSSKGTSWVLPKGHIEPGEHPEAAAVREVCEEAATLAEILAPIGVVSWASGEKAKRVLFYFMRAISSVPSQEAREIRWLSCESALSYLCRPEARSLLHEAERTFAGFGEARRVPSLLQLRVALL